MAQKVIHTVIALAAVFTSASAVPMMPFSYGLMGLGGIGGGLFGGHGDPMMGRFIGASFNDRHTFNGHSSNEPYMGAPQPRPTTLNGVSRTFQEDGTVREGTAVTIRSSVPNVVGHNRGLGGYGSPAFGLGGGGGGKGLYGGFGGAGMYGGLNAGLMGSMYGMGYGGMFGPQDQLEALIEDQKADDFVMTKALVVITEAARSADEICPTGPILTEPRNANSDHGFGYGGLGGLGGVGAYAGPSNMLDGYGSPYGGGPDFGVIAEVMLKPGLNTFTIQGLGPFTKIEQLAGRGLAFCRDVQIGVDGRPSCMGDYIFSCVKLGFSANPQGIIPPR